MPIAYRILKEKAYNMSLPSPPPQGFEPRPQPAAWISLSVTSCQPTSRSWRLEPLDHTTPHDSFIHLTTFFHIFQSLTFTNRRGIPKDWFEEIYQTMHKCKIRNADNSLPFSNLCSEKEASFFFKHDLFDGFPWHVYDNDKHFKHFICISKRFTIINDM